MTTGGATGGSARGGSRAKDTFTSAGRYSLVLEVSRGYLGALWLGRDPTAGEPVFIRHIAPLASASTRSAILESARWSATGEAPGTTEIIEGRSSVDVVRPFLDGEPLRALLRTAALRHTIAESAVLLGVARDLLSQLTSLHARAAREKSPHASGSVHPDSIFVGLDGRVHLIDAGVGAAASAREPWRSDPQRVGYFAPEQIDPRGVVDARTDVFALGVILWEAFGNRRLFPGNDAKTARERVQKGTIARLDATGRSSVPGTSTEIADLIARALERDPAARFQSAEEMGAALGRLECADATAIGTWVGGLADTAIAKRRQVLERVSSGTLSGLAPPSSRPSVAPSSHPSVAPSSRPSVAPSSRPSVAPSSHPGVHDANPSLPPPEPTHDANPSLPPPEPIHDANPSLPPPESAHDAVPSLPPPEPAHDAVPSSPGMEPAAEVPDAAPVVPDFDDPPAGIAAAPGVGSGDLTPVPGEGPQSPSDTPPPPPSKRQHQLPRAPPRPSLSPRPRSEEESLPAPAPALSSPIQPSAFATLTAPAPRSRGATLAVAAVALGVAAAAVGFWVGRDRPDHGAATAPRAAPPRTTRAAESTKPAPAVADEPAPRVTESAALPSTTPSVPPVRSAGPVEPTPPETLTTAPAAAVPELHAKEAKTPLPAVALHRPPPSHSKPNSGYKPGGI